MDNCATCETDIFCRDMRQCLHAMLLQKYEDPEITDLEELAGDDGEMIFKKHWRQNAFKKELNDEERKIIKSAINF